MSISLYFTYVTYVSPIPELQHCTPERGAQTQFWVAQAADVRQKNKGNSMANEWPMQCHYWWATKWHEIHGFSKLTASFFLLHHGACTNAWFDAGWCDEGDERGRDWNMIWPGNFSRSCPGCFAAPLLHPLYIKLWVVYMTRHIGEQRWTRLACTVPHARPLWRQGFLSGNSALAQFARKTRWFVYVRMCMCLCVYIYMICGLEVVARENE